MFEHMHACHITQPDGSRICSKTNEVRPGPQPGAIYRNEKGDDWKVVGVAWNEEELSWDLLKVTSSEKQSGQQEQQQGQHQYEEAKMTL